MVSTRHLYNGSSFQQGTLCILESDPINIIKFKYWCSTGINTWSLLFLIYINVIVNLSNVLSFVLFADDTTVYVQNDSIDSAIEILNTELAKVALWFDPQTYPSNKLTQMIMLSRNIF